ncbi:amino acid transporter [Aspergillus japonicus CBS 114.51]|uniref:Amino acid transporter n=2 Tax=Aspergillus TaxID=5052 RepID=A0A2V5HMC1_ASPV1|nr:amino acid transporter [Aspergillus japonicus CBS 114.51]PYI13087.1 amino acid transporter [Aspergillus violaceofuscus CBS 115571]RAH81900.1 amino acid transporter [Aspergillus japonicus CBS 114.51]
MSNRQNLQQSNMKEPVVTGFQSMEVNEANDVDEVKGTRYDMTEMDRMGKAQQFKRNIRPLAALSFSAVLQATWEYILLSNYQGLQDGGLAGMLWSYVWSTVGFGFIIVSLAEMASMAPTSGGQYHWVSEFAPARYQKFLSYVTGWMSVLAWQAGTASGSYLTGSIIQGLISVRDPSYDATGWQGTLFVFAMILVAYYFNVYASGLMARMQNVLLATHVLCWVVIVVSLWVLAPLQPAEAVFTKFENFGGFSSMGLTVMVGQLSAIYGCLSSDATAHMSEEIKDAGRYVPIAITWSYFANAILALIVLITMLFATPSVEDALNDESGYPLIYVFKQATDTSGVNGLMAIILIPVILSNILFNASTARQTFSFARDLGLPFSKWTAKVDEKRKLPVNSVILTCVFSALLALINIGSETAFNAVVSLNVAALMFSYSISMSCLIWRKLYHPESLPPARWGLGRYGLAVNIIGLVYVLFALFWSFWPSELPVAADNFNWSVVIFVAIFILSLVMYVVKGRREYEGPVTLVKKGGHDL